MSAKLALIAGVIGQEGSFLARLLLEKGSEVHGVKRRSFSFNFGRIEDIGVSLEFRGDGADEKAYCADSGRCLIKMDPRYFRPTEVDRLLGDAGKASAEMDWEAKTLMRALVHEMVQADSARIGGR